MGIINCADELMVILNNNACICSEEASLLRPSNRIFGVSCIQDTTVGEIPPPPKPLTCRPYDNSYPATCAKDFLAHKKQIRHCCRHEAVIASSSCGGSERMLVQVFVGG